MSHHKRTGALAVAALLAGVGMALAEGPHDAPGMVSIEGAAGVVYGAGPANLPKGTLLSKLAGDPAKP